MRACLYVCVRKNPAVCTMPRKENQIMMKQLTENGWGDDPWLLRGGDKGAPTLANAAEIVPAGALPPLSNRKGYLVIGDPANSGLSGETREKCRTLDEFGRSVSLLQVMCVIPSIVVTSFTLPSWSVTSSVQNRVQNLYYICIRYGRSTRGEFRGNKHCQDVLLSSGFVFAVRISLESENSREDLTTWDKLYWRFTSKEKSAWEGATVAKYKISQMHPRKHVSI